MVTRAKSNLKPSEILSSLGVSALSLSKLPKVSGSLIELWPEQEDAVSFVLSRDETALFFEQRTGKTFITMSVIERQPRDIFAGVLVCILTNKETTWRDNLTKFLPWLNVTSDWEEYKALPCPKLLLIHHDALHTVAKKIKGKKWITFCAVDESHRWKARGSRVSRAGAKLAFIKKKLLLTGTPIEKQPKDLWAQFRFLAPDIMGSWKEFEEEFMLFDDIEIDYKRFPPGTQRWKFKVMQRGMLRSKAEFDYTKLPKLIRWIKPFCIRMTREQAGIKRVKVEELLVPMGPQQTAMYKAMKKAGVLRLPGGARAMAPMKVTEIMKRREIASGFVYDDEGDLHYIDDAKLEALVKLFKKLPKPLVVFCAFKPDNDRVTERLRSLGYDIEQLTGATSRKRKPIIQRMFQKAQLDGLVCQVRAGGVGIDLWKASYGIVHSMEHSSITWEQMSSRMDNKFKKTASKLIVLSADATIDMDLFDLVIQKGFDAERVMQSLMKGAR